MASFEIKTLDGRTFSVDAPEGTTREQAYMYVQNSLRGEGNQGAGNTSPAKVAEYGDEEFYESYNPNAARDVADVGVGLLSGSAKALGAIAGLGSYVPYLNKIADPVAAKLQEFGGFIDESLLSDRQKEINKELATRLAEVAPDLPEDATFNDYMEALKAGGGEAYEYIKDHPTQVFNLIAASAPYILGGGVITKGLQAGAKVAKLEKVSKVLKTPYVGGAVGEGMIVGGQVVTDMIEATGSSGEYSADRLKALGTIPLTTALSLLGGRATKALKGIDVDTAGYSLINGTKILGENAKKGVLNTAYKTGVGVIVEGLEETAQSGSEKYWENYATNPGYDMLQPNLLKDVGPEAVLGGATGAGQGGLINLGAGLIPNKAAGNTTSEETPEIQQIENFVAEQEAKDEEIKQQAEEVNVEKNKARVLHAATFPNEKEWNKINKKDEFDKVRLQIADPESETSKDFRAWQEVEGDGVVGKYDTEPGTNIPLAETVRAYLGKQSTATAPGLYTQALDEHAELQELKATDSPARQKRINKLLQTLLDTRNAALEANNMEQLEALNQAVAKHAETNPSFPARWKEFIRNSAVKPKKEAKKEAKKKPKKEDKPIGQYSQAEIQKMMDNAVTLDLDVIDTEDLGASETLGTVEDEKTAGDQEGQDLFKYIKEEALRLRGDTGYLGIDDSPATQDLNTELEGLLDDHNASLEEGDTEMVAAIEEEVLELAKQAPALEETFREAAIRKNATKKVVKKEVVTPPVEEEVVVDEGDEKMVDVLNRDNSELSQKEFEEKHPGFKDVWGFSEVTQDDVDARGEPARVLGDFGIPGTWERELAKFLDSASKRGVLSDYVSFKSSMAYVVKKDDTQESIAAKFDSSVEEIFPKPEKVKKKVKVNDKRLKNPTYRVEYSDAEIVPLEVNSRIQIPLNKKVFNSLPIEEKYKAAKWDMSKLSDELGLIDESTGQLYDSVKGKQNIKDAFSSYRKKQIAVGKDKTNPRELIDRTMERTAFAEAFSGENESDFVKTETATKESQSDIDEETASMERGDKPAKEKTTEADISGWSTRDTGDVTLAQVSQKTEGETDIQILTSPENYKVGNVNDAKAKKQIAAKLVELKSEARKLKGAATRAETSLNTTQGKLKKAKGKTRIATLTKEVRKLKSAATKKRNEANKAVEAVKDIEGFKTITDKGRVKKQREFDSRDTELPGTAKLETLEQQEKEKKKLIATAKSILEGTDANKINQVKALESMWDDNKTESTPTFSNLTMPQQLEWSGRVLLALHDKAPKDIKVQQKLMEETLDEYDGKPTAQNKEVAARRKLADKQIKARKLKLNRKEDTAKISTKAVAEAYGKAKLEPIYKKFWRSHSDNSILKTHLKNENFGAYQRVVDKRVAAFNALTKEQQSEKSKAFTSTLDTSTQNWKLLKSDNPKKKENLENMFRRLLGEKGYKRIRNRVYYFNNVQEARQVMQEEFGADQTVGSESAFVQKWRISGQPDIIAFILNRIRDGAEEFTFIHEVAGHIGFDNLLTAQERKAIQNKILNWAMEDRLKYEGNALYDLALKDLLAAGWKVDTDGYMLNEDGQRIKMADSIEHLASRFAIKRANNKGYAEEFIDKKTGERSFKIPSDVLTSETLAYFLESSAELGVMPSQTTDAGKILYKMKKAMMKFLSYFGKISDFNMTAQDFMDMALGLAKVDLESGFRFGRKPPSQKVIKAIRIATASTQLDNVIDTFPGVISKAVQRFAQQPADPSDIKNWDAEIDAAARRRFPKDKGKYVANDGSRVPLAEWGDFQKRKSRDEKAFRKAAKIHIEQMLRDAAENESRMANPEGDSYKRFTKEENDNSKKEAKKDRERIIEKYPALLSMYDTLADGIKASQKSMRFRGDFINKYQAKLPGLKAAADIILASGKLSRNIKKKVDNIAVLERILKPERRRVVNKVLEVATSKQLWPSQMSPTKDAEGNEVPRRKVTVDADFKKLFESMLTSAEQSLIMQVFEHGEDMIQMYREISKTLGLESDFFSITQLEGPYSPLRRFGKHTVTLRSQTLINLEKKLEEGELPPQAKRIATARLKELRSNGKHFWYEHFPNAGQAKRFQRKQEKTGNWGNTSYAKKAVVLGDRGTADQKVLEQINAGLELSQMDKVAKAQFKRIIDDIYTASISESNARQGQQLRQNIKGAEQNMLRSFVVNASSEANLIANLKYGRETNIAIATVLKNANEIDERKDTPDGAMRNVYNMLANHYNIKLQKRNHPLVDSTASFITAWLLTTSLSYHLQNGTQTIAVAVPVLAADFKSYWKVMNQLPQSYRIGHNVITYDKKIPFVGSKVATWTLNINLEDLRQEDEWALPILALLDEMELLDLGIEQDLNDTNTQDTGFAAADKGIRAAGSISHRLYQVPRGVEAYNRIATAVTAYRLALDNPKVMDILKTNPLDYAIKKTQDTQGDFTADGAPYALKWVMEKWGGVGKLALQYKKFPLLMLWNYSRSINMIWAGESKEQRAIGWRATRNLLAHTLTLSGVRGLPAIGAIYAMTVFLMAMFDGEDEDEKDSNPMLTDGAFERAIIEAFPDSPKLAEAIYRGPLTSLTGVDLSQKLSHDKIASILPYTDLEISEEGFKNIGVGLMGPFGNVAMNFAIASEHFKNGNTYKGIEMLMPKGLRDPMEAVRLGTDGYTNRKNRVLAPPSDFKTIDLMWKAMGIPSSEIGKLKWKRSEQYQIEKFFADRQSSLLTQYENATSNDNYEDVDRIFAEWDAIQDGKDNIRHFFNFAPSALPRTSIESVLDVPLKKWRYEQDAQETLGTGDFRKAQ
tara:strand:+ start:56 stop:8422 length:8367 start_codon:yes stop_codon:yes gene_type:complete